MSAELLAGLRVLDLTTIVVGPACTLRLADYGADVIKVEPLEGDLMRVLGGPSPSGSHAASYLHLNRGKRSVCLDLKKPEAHVAIGRLVESCDVVVANMRPDALERLGLDAATLLRRKPDLVHCTITGFGPGGPYRGAPAYDSVVQGASGIAALFERRDGTPAYVPLVLCDHVVGEIAVGAILAALLNRHRTGQGKAIEVPMHETIAAMVLHEHLGPSTFEPPIGPPGDTRILNPGNCPAQTADGWISLTANTDDQVRGLFRAAGREDLLQDVRFRTVANRFSNADAWLRTRNDMLRNLTTAECLTLLAEHDVPAMPCHSLDTLVDDPHLTAVQLISMQDHLVERRVRALRPTLVVDGDVSQPRFSAPPAGWDTREVLREAGLDHSEIDALLESGAAAQSSKEKI
jgi:crotonobetainyl-CoA:carnitine CoA-transferase CaiB-like acyl-CoA transferase